MIQAFQPVPAEALRKQAGLFRRLAAASRDAAAAERFRRWAESCEADADDEARRSEGQAQNLRHGRAPHQEPR